MNLPDPTIPPDQIEERSMAAIEAEVPHPRPFAGDQWLVVRRMIHASADFELLDLVRFHPDAVRAALDALAPGATLVTDTEMAKCGIPARRLDRLGCRAVCLMNDPAVAQAAAARNVTRAFAAVDLAAERHPGAVFVVGNAPTALLRILDLAAQGRLRPPLVVGMPVGFVNAMESKELLLNQTAIPFITIRGRKGGSPLAAAAVNALADIALERFNK